MKVYVLTTWGEQDCDPSTVHGVFRTLQGAKDVANEWERAAANEEAGELVWHDNMGGGSSTEWMNLSVFIDACEMQS